MEEKKVEEQKEEVKEVVPKVPRPLEETVEVLCSKCDKMIPLCKLGKACLYSRAPLKQVLL